MDIVCPVLEKDFGRFCILFRSLEKFCIDPFKVYLVSPTGESPIRNKKIVTIKESKIDKNLSLKCFHDKGWWKQQLIKLLSFRFCETEHILSLDADCFAVKPFVFSDFLSHNKIKTRVSKAGSWDNWYIGSSNILQLELFPNWENNRIGVTPFIFSHDILSGLDKYLTTLYKKHAVFLLKNTHLNDNQPIDNSTNVWSEYCLYHVYAVSSGFWGIYHKNDSNFKLYGNCFWNSEDAEKWDAKKSFDNPKFYFTVAQSVSGKSSDWVEDKIKLYV